ncbi:lipase member K isoform X2 [Folsomia candida]|nr:lipase member K isoform X2 [Folsomia candida]XP_035707171.1 lipase member K isoform X2 [Folsomia candida]XP_035707172.1 lipase member K isoform X2 [Folsomia candida]
MGLPEGLISSLGNLLSSLAELVGAVTGDRKMVMKSTTVQKALLQGSCNGIVMEASTCASSSINNNTKKKPKAAEENQTNSIYKNPDIGLCVSELIQKYGFPFESHEVVTKDKYILNLFRIPHGRQGPHSRGDKPPVLLAHGLLNSAGAWVIHEPDKALAYMLADRGYDTWMLNSRGCTYSKGHETLSAQDKEFWDFSFHEMGTMDVPAVIDHILATTGHPNLYYVGHSLGNTKLMIAINEDENLVGKVKLLVCFAPAVYLYMTTARLLSLNAPFFKLQKAILDYFTGGELMSKPFVQQFKKFLPYPEYFAAKVVTMSMYLMGGYNPDQIHWPGLPVVAGHTPSSSSVRTYIHCLQYFINSEFQQYDYGSADANLQAYGQPTPLKYDLTKVTCPTVIFYGENDLLCRPQAVEQLSKELPNVVGYHRVDCDKFSHTDFLYAKDADTLVYNKLIYMLEEWTRPENSVS